MKFGLNLLFYALCGVIMSLFLSAVCKIFKFDMNQTFLMIACVSFFLPIALVLKKPIYFIFFAMQIAMFLALLWHDNANLLYTIIKESFFISKSTFVVKNLFLSLLTLIDMMILGFEAKNLLANTTKRRKVGKKSAK